MAFLDENYLLDNAASRNIYPEIASLPIIDAHNHCDVKALAGDRMYNDIWEAEAATDHYVWELMRKCGVQEELITGKDVDNRTKWNALAGVFELFAGNPTYEWIHLDLRRRLGIDLEINAENADAIWEQSKALFAKPEFSQQSLILSMNVEAMCSTDDPVDTLEWHSKLAEGRLAGRVRPTFRPDAAMNIDKPTWSAYVDKLGARWNCEINSLDVFLECLAKSHEFMGKMGCRASDHGVCVPYGYQLDKESAARIFNNVRGGNAPGRDEAAAFKAFFLNEMAELDAAAGWVFQLHIGAVRDVRRTLEERLGADVGGDIGDHEISIVRPLLPLLNRFDDRLKVVLYNMVPCHNATLAMLSRAFGSKVSLGSAWWLNDSYYGMKCQLESESTIDLYSNMSGMVSDSRKILSYGSRFEMYRRTLASSLGRAVERGQMSEKVAVKLAKHICYDRPKALFGF